MNLNESGGIWNRRAREPPARGLEILGNLAVIFPKNLDGRGGLWDIAWRSPPSASKTSSPGRPMLAVGVLNMSRVDAA